MWTKRDNPVFDDGNLKKMAYERQKRMEEYIKYQMKIKKEESDKKFFDYIYEKYGKK